VKPPPKPVEPPKVLEPPKSVEQPKAEIEVKEKKAPPEKPKPVVQPKPEPKPAPKVDVQAEQQAAEQRAAEAAQAAARGRMINEYIGLIRAKIRRNIVMPQGVADDALAIFDVTLLPDGEVLVAKLKKSSGNNAYDNNVNRAILKSQPLPLPPDVTLFQQNFRNLELKFKPKE
jgi:colicin import membrane protein